MRGVLVGAGFISGGHLAAYRGSRHLRVGAVAERVTRRRLVVTRDHPDLAVYPDLATALEREEVEFVDICTPPRWHRELILQALQAGKHVLCEKPFLTHEADYGPVQRAAAATDRRVVAAHNYLYSPAARTLTATVRNPRFGEILGGHFRTVRRGHARGVDEFRPDWRRDRSIGGGGILTDHGPHSVYLASSVMGAWPSRVSCLGGHLRDDPWSDTEDTAWLTLDYGSAQVRVDLTWAGGARSTEYTVWGSGGLVTVAGDSVTTALGGDVDRRTVVSDFDDPRHSSWFSGVLDDFVAAVTDRVPARETLHEPYMTTAVLQAAYRSMRFDGRWEIVDHAREQTTAHRTAVAQSRLAQQATR